MEKSNNELRTEININLSKLYMLYGRTQICIHKSLNKELIDESITNLSKLYKQYGRTEICIQKSLNKDSGITLGYILTENLFEKKREKNRLCYNDLILQIIGKINDENDNYYFNITIEKMTSEEAFCYTLPYRMMEDDYWHDLINQKEIFRYLISREDK